MINRKTEAYKMKIVKIQARKHDKVVTIPTEMHRIVGNAEYLKCTADEHGLHYLPVVA